MRQVWKFSQNVIYCIQKFILYLMYPFFTIPFFAASFLRSITIYVYEHSWFSFLYANNIFVRYFNLTSFPFMFLFCAYSNHRMSKERIRKIILNYTQQPLFGAYIVLWESNKEWSKSKVTLLFAVKRGLHSSEYYELNVHKLYNNNSNCIYWKFIMLCNFPLWASAFFVCEYFDTCS